MAIRVGINGFGRIGRLSLRVMLNHPNIECVGVNDLIDAKTMAHLFKYDSAHGMFDGEVTASTEALTINGKKVPISSEKDPTKLPWKALECDIVLECTGIFRDTTKAGMHITAGAKRVVISAPAKGDVPTFVYNVNHNDYDPSKHTVISNASCTTNCLAPVAKVLDENFGIERGFMTTIHSYTSDQSIVDAPHADLRRARAAAISQIPTTTGAAKAVGLVLPQLKGKLDGMAVRVPTVNVSLVDLVASVKKETTAEEVNAALKAAANGPMKNTLQYSEDPCVSVDFMGNSHGSIVDAASTKVNGNLVKLLAWYDNEWGFCCQMVRMIEHMSK